MEEEELPDQVPQCNDLPQINFQVPAILEHEVVAQPAHYVPERNQDQAYRYTATKCSKCGNYGKTAYWRHCIICGEKFWLL